MGNRTIRFSRNNRSNRVISFAAAIVVTVVGFIMFQPFLWSVLIFGEDHKITQSVFLMGISFIVGLPTFLFGLVNLFLDDPAGYSSTAELDVQRIRYTTETDSMRRK